MEMGGSSSSSDSHLGLKFGQKAYFEDDEPKSEVGLSSSPAAPKKVRSSGSGSHPPRCQVEGCNLDLSDASKTYYARHKVCGAHSKTAKVVVNGLQQRFCQQCSRFHQLQEFDQMKRSCRRRLVGHNERRRKPTSSGTVLADRYANQPNYIFENGVGSGGFVMDFASGSRARVVNWPNTRVATITEKFPWQSHLENPPPYINQHVPQESNCALSLLSNHTSASRNQALMHDYYVNSPHMIQPQAPTGTIVHGHFPTGWGFDTNEVPLGLGSSYPGELGLGQQGGRRYDSSAADHINWSL